jgi:DNA-binding response OmpR family regulator
MDPDCNRHPRVGTFGSWKTINPNRLCDCDLKPGTSQEMLDYLSLLPDPPLLILSSRLPDERLWAEALNLGAYDMLAKPYDSADVIRIVSLAWQRWLDRHGIHNNTTEQGKWCRRIAEQASSPGNKSETTGEALPIAWKLHPETK